MTGRLFNQVKRKLNVTWQDAETDARIEDIIVSAIPIMKHKLGIVEADFDFGNAGAENRLFLSYCLYEWNHSAFEFDGNYAGEIGQIRAKHEVKHYLANEVGESE